MVEIHVVEEVAQEKRVHLANAVVQLRRLRGVRLEGRFSKRGVPL